MKTLFDLDKTELLNLKEACDWASNYLNKNVAESNISYLIQYGKIKKIEYNGSIYVELDELKKYYDSYYGKREIDWKRKLGDDLNWHLSFDYLREADTTKHVHRLHPYKGKFIPQLVQYFIDDHTDEFKHEVFFKKGDVILDPFCGSGTTLVQANETGIHAIGIDISEFNSLISNAKIFKYDLIDLHKQIKKITVQLKQFVIDSKAIAFEDRLLQELNTFNNLYFPTPGFKIKVEQNEIDEKEYSIQKDEEFLPIFVNLINKYGLTLEQDKQYTFLDKWYLQPIRDEFDFLFEKIKTIENKRTKLILSIILSRTIRSCRATTHSDLATLKEPIITTYYCVKHKKICKPLFTITRWWETYCKDTIKRLSFFANLRTNTYQICLSGDSRTFDLYSELKKRSPTLAKLVQQKKIQGIFSSPPYVGLIDYHEQHAYAYDLFGFKRKDNFEIGPLSKGQSTEAKRNYVEEITDVLNHCKKYLANDYNVFFVANDKYNLYPIIAEKAGMKIVNKYKRPVLNRTERDKGAYSEIIFHFKSRQS